MVKDCKTCKNGNNYPIFWYNVNFFW
jgi:hypothetical protein